MSEYLTPGRVKGNSVFYENTLVIVTNLSLNDLLNR